MLHLWYLCHYLKMSGSCRLNEGCVRACRLIEGRFQPRPDFPEVLTCE